MAKYNEILTGRHNSFVRRLFGMKAGAPAPQVSSEISVSHPIFHGRENRFIEDWKVYGVFATQNAVAANNSRFLLRNPATSGVVAVVELWTITTNAAVTVEMQYGQGLTVDLATVLAARAMDGRIKNNPCCKFSFAADVAGGQIGQTVWAQTLNGSVTLPLTADTHVCLTPGDEIVIQNDTVNSAMSLALWWRERPLDEGERI